MTTGESEGRFFYKTNRFECELECFSVDSVLGRIWDATYRYNQSRTVCLSVGILVTTMSPAKNG